MKKIIPILFLALASSALAEGHPEVAAVSTSGTTARSAKLGPGYKLVYCSVATHYATGNSAVTATTDDLTLPAASAVGVLVEPTEPYMAFILDSSTGTCSIYARNRMPGSLPPVFAASSGSVDGQVISPSSVFTTSLVASTNIVAGGGIQAAAGPLIVGDGATKGGTLSAGSASLTVAGVTDGDVTVTANGAGLLTLDGATAALGASTATSTTIGRTGQSTALNGTIAFGSTLPALTSSGNITTSSTSTPTLGCTGAAACALQSASGQSITVDAAGGTATASLGATNATTVTVGRSGNTATNLNGVVVAGASTTAGTITLSGGTGTATVRSGARCVCSETTSAATPGKCAVSSTTLTATYGVGTDVINYICL